MRAKKREHFIVLLSKVAYLRLLYNTREIRVIKDEVLHGRLVGCAGYNSIVEERAPRRALFPKSPPVEKPRFEIALAKSAKGMRPHQLGTQVGPFKTQERPEGNGPRLGALACIVCNSRVLKDIRIVKELIMLGINGKGVYKGEVVNNCRPVLHVRGLSPVVKVGLHVHGIAFDGPHLNSTFLCFNEDVLIKKERVKEVVFVTKVLLPLPKPRLLRTFFVRDVVVVCRAITDKHDYLPVLVVRH